ncbi:MAG TPA: tRNA (guanosine(46)-N7)-methyltransferase TrmB [Chthoniobacterales bacterium]|jgi:tRNA (guanine-N7-)-methyltransferase
MAVEFVPSSIVDPINFFEIFNRDAPVEIDLGCGDGTFLAARAATNPERNFLGIERLIGRVRAGCRKTTRLHLENVRILRMESSYAIAHLMRAESVSAVHLLFPDPWPKRRHQRRRLFTTEFTGAVHRALEIGGLFHVATDHAPYFQMIQKMIPIDLFSAVEDPLQFPLSRFEQNFTERQMPIYRLLLRKISPVR